LASREYAVLKNFMVHPVPEGDYNVETFCDFEDIALLLRLAKRSYPEAVPYLEKVSKPDTD
jgi:hypothetical protein